jgi:hypothetical protein
MTFLFLHKCELGFQRLSAPYCLLQKEGEGEQDVLGMSTEDIVEQYISFSVLYSQYQWWGGEYVPMVMVMERGETKTVWYWKGFPTTTLISERQVCPWALIV